jgi:16S rRNA (guanine(966)-N(2))-methyltransferase RsmD
VQIIAGKYRGRKITSVPSGDIRPCSSRVKKSLFDTLSARIAFEGLVVLDLFAGFGNMGFEALSRGAGSVCFVDRHPESIRCISDTAGRLGVSGQIRIVRSDVPAFVDRTEERFGLVFCDPPYAWSDYDTLIGSIAGSSMLEEDGLLLVEHQADRDFRQSPYYLMHKDYGMTTVTFFQHRDACQ